MVCADDFPFWVGNFSARSAYCPLPDAGRHPLRGAFLYGSRFHRAEIRYDARTTTRDDAGLCPAACARIFSIFHLAAIQTDTGQRDSAARTFAGTRPICGKPKSPCFLERTGQGSPLFAGGNLSGARGRRLALFDRQRVERMGRANLRQFLVEHSTPNRHRISWRRKMFDSCPASEPVGYYHAHLKSYCSKSVDLSAAQRFPRGFLVHWCLPAVSFFPVDASTRTEVTSSGACGPRSPSRRP